MALEAFVDLCVADVAASVEFYRRLLDLDVLADQGWYVELGRAERILLAVVQAGHDTLPAAAGGPPRGVLVSFHVDDVAGLAQRATELGCRIVYDLVREFGQHHFMVLDPDGAVVDLIERVPFTTADRPRLVGYRRQHRQRFAP